MLKIGGFQKLSLQDFPGHVAAVCFTAGCQLRCPYCHNPELVLLKKNRDHESYPSKLDDFFLYLSQRKNLLDAVVISGGEPLIQKDIIGTLHRIKNMGFAIKLDTNGLHPDALLHILANGLIDYVALDYKNTRDNWPQTVGLTRAQTISKASYLYERWCTSLKLLQRYAVPFELRTTVVRELHSMDTLQQMALDLHTQNAGYLPWFLQSFKNSGSLLHDWRPQAPPLSLSAYSLDEMHQIECILKPWIPFIHLRTH